MELGKIIQDLLSDKYVGERCRFDHLTILVESVNVEFYIDCCVLKVCFCGSDMDGKHGIVRLCQLCAAPQILPRDPTPASPPPSASPEPAA